MKWSWKKKLLLGAIMLVGGSSLAAIPGNVLQDDGAAQVHKWNWDIQAPLTVTDGGINTWDISCQNGDDDGVTKGCVTFVDGDFDIVGGVVDLAAIIDATTGFTVGGAAAIGDLLVGDGTTFSPESDFTNLGHTHADAANGGTIDIDDLANQSTWATAATKTTADLIIDGIEVDFEAGGAEGFPRLAQSTTAPATACDAAAESGRLYMDTDAAANGKLSICTGAGGWEVVGGAGGMSSFDIDGDNNSPQTISDGQEALFVGGAGIDTTAGVTRQVSFATDSTEASFLASGTIAAAADGAIVIDTNGDASTITTPVLSYQSTADYFVFGVDAYPTADQQVMKYNAGTNKVIWASATGDQYRTIALIDWSVDAAGNPPQSELLGTTFKRDVFSFDPGATEEEMWLVMPVPGDYNATGTAPTIEVTFSGDNTNTGNVCFCISIGDQGPGTTIDPTAEETDCAEGAGTGVADQVIQGTATFTASTLAAGNLMGLRLWRDTDGLDANCTDDTFTGDASIHHIEFKYGT